MQENTAKPSFLLSQILARNPANFAGNAQPVDIVDAGDGTPTGLVIHVFGKDHANFKATQAKIEREKLEKIKKGGEKELSLDERNRMEAEVLAACISHTNSPEFPTTQNDRVALLLEHPWIGEQLDKVIGNRKVFMGPSKTA